MYQNQHLIPIKLNLVGCQDLNYNRLSLTHQLPSQLITGDRGSVAAGLEAALDDVGGSLIDSQLFLEKTALRLVDGLGMSGQGCRLGVVVCGNRHK